VVVESWPATSCPVAAVVTAKRAKLDAAQASRNFDGGEAKAAVARAARAARAAGVQPEKLIIELKTLMREVALPAMRAWYRSVLTDRVIVWAIEAFYGIADAAAPDRQD